MQEQGDGPNSKGSPIGTPWVSLHTLHTQVMKHITIHHKTLQIKFTNLSFKMFAKLRSFRRF